MSPSFEISIGKNGWIPALVNHQHCGSGPPLKRLGSLSSALLRRNSTGAWSVRVAELLDLGRPLKKCRAGRCVDLSAIEENIDRTGTPARASVAETVADLYVSRFPALVECLKRDGGVLRDGYGLARDSQLSDSCGRCSVGDRRYQIVNRSIPAS